jgi:FkbM family methyltransferase
LNTEKLEYLVRRTANKAGVDIHRHRPEDSLPGRIVTMLNHHNVNVVLDVGANIGQFARAIRESGYASRIVSFEPLQSVHEELQEACSKDPNWEAAPRMAIGAEEGEVEMNVAGNSFSSSALPMLNEHLKAAPNSASIGVEQAPQATLDIASSDYIRESDVVFIKIDTQGFEGFVLDGATETLGRAIGVHVELSFIPLYDGQPLFDEIVERIRSTGFKLWGIWNGIHDPESGRMLQVDATFFRES